MKRIKLTQNKYTIIDDEDFKELSKHNWFHSHNYAGRRVGLKNDYMHRILINAPKNKSVDHINGNGLDNRKENLRLCTHQQNTRNRKPNLNTFSGFKGVSWHNRDKLWRARITLNSKEITIGYSKIKEKAIEMYNKAALKYHGEFARLNKIE